MATTVEFTSAFWVSGTASSSRQFCSVGSKWIQGMPKPVTVSASMGLRRLVDKPQKMGNRKASAMTIARSEATA